MGLQIAKMQKTARKMGTKAAEAGAPNREDCAPDAYKIGDGAEFVRNMLRVGEQSQKLLAEFIRAQTEKGPGPHDPLNLTDTFTALLGGIAAHPSVYLLLSDLLLRVLFEHYY